MGRGAADTEEIYPGRPDLDLRQRVLIANRATLFLRRNPGSSSFTATDLVADRDRLTEEEISKRVAPIAASLVQLEGMGRVEVVGGDPKDLTYAFTDTTTVEISDEESFGVLR
jgi:hypothetical protein